MANITIRDISDKTKENLRVQAAKAGVSLEAYVRHILQQASQSKGEKFNDITGLMDKYFGSKFGVELELPERGTKREIPEFGE